MSQNNENKSPKSSKVKESHRKWTKGVMSPGFTILPSVLFEKQDALGLKPAELNVLLHLCVSWWKKENTPRLSKGTIAKRMGVSPSTVQRHVRNMESRGLIKRHRRVNEENNARATNRYDLQPLIDTLIPIASKLKQERKEKQARKRKSGAE